MLRRLARWAGSIPALLPLGFLAAIVLTLVFATGLENFGLSFFGTDWNPSTGDPSKAVFGIMTFVVGTLITSVFALVFALGLSLALALSIVFYLPPRMSQVLAPFVDLLAGIPSVVYGIWGFWIVAPVFGETINPTIVRYLGWIPGLQGPVIASGVGIPLAILILTLMIVPVTTTLIRDSLRAVPQALDESGLALGATRWEVIRRVDIPYAKRGMWSAVLLGFGRAVGETVAVFMVIGDATKLPASLLDVSYTMPGALVGQLDSAFIQPNYLHALAELAIVLFLITFVVNFAGRRFVSRIVVRPTGALSVRGAGP